MLATDPACSIGLLDVGASWDGPDFWGQGEHRTLTTVHGFYSADGTGSAQGVLARMIFSEGLAVDAPAGWVLDTSTPAPNDWKYTGPSTWASHQPVEAVWGLIRNSDGPQKVDYSLTTTTPRVLPAQSLDLPWEIEEIVEVDATLTASMPTENGYNQDVDPDTPGLQLHPGDLATYRLVVGNNGPGVAPIQVDNGGVWSTFVGGVQDAWFASGEPVPWSNDEREFLTILPDIAVGTSKTMYVQVRVGDVDVPEEVELVWEAGVSVGFVDNNSDNSVDGVRFGVVPEAA
jgi:hypothetical protein